MASAAASAVLLALAGCSSTEAAPSSTPSEGAPTPTAPTPTAPTPTAPTPTAPTRSGGVTPPSSPQRLLVRTARWRLPVPVAREAVVATPDGLVVAGGLVAGDQSTSSSYRLDPSTGRARALPNLSVPVHDTAGVLLGGRPVVIGGGNASEQDVVQARRGGRWSVTGHLPETRSDLTVVSVSGRAVVLGGYDAHAPAVPTILASADGTTWSALGRLAVPVRYAAGVVSDHAVWLFGGERSGVEQRVVQRIDPVSGRARVVARLPMPLGHASAVALGDRILLVGGRTDPGTPTDRMWWFDPTRGTFAAAGRLRYPLADSAVAVVGPVAYLVGGESPLVTDRVLQVSLH